MSITYKILDADMVLLPSGVYDVVEEEEKVAQDIAESIQNNYDQDNPSWFNGSLLYKLIGDASFAARALRAGLTIESLIHSIIDDCINRLMDLQNEDDYCSDKERIVEIKVLQVQRVGSMSYFFYLVCLNDSGEPVRADFLIRLLPGLPAGISDNLAGGTESLQSVSKTFL